MGPDFVYDDDKPLAFGEILGRVLFVLFATVVYAVLTACLGSGCSSIPLPPGAMGQVSVVGIDISPAGSTPTAPSVTFGSKTVILSTATPDGGSGFNKFSATAPGIKVTGTVASGSASEKITAGGITPIDPDEPVPKK